MSLFSDQSVHSLLKAEEAAHLLRISVRKLWHLTSQGTLNCVQVGKRSTRWREVDIAKFIQSL